MSKNKVYALVDCNNFFVSCERIFAPFLESKPVVVLSSNDGCAISRSNEAKKLGIKMGEPFFKFKNLYDTKKVEVLSSNFELYSDISQRVMKSLRILNPSMEVYSVDEAFLDLSKISPLDYESFATEIKHKIKQWTGIPVSIGIAPTKTLAKIANLKAKNTNNIFNLFNLTNIDEFLETIEIEEIWGIGRKIAPKLRIYGIGNAKDLKYADQQFIRKLFSILVEKTLHELNGISCIDLHNSNDAKKSITYSRSFGKNATKLEELESILANYVSKACEKLRKDKLVAQEACISIRTNLLKATEKYNNSACILLPVPSNNSIELLKLLKPVLKSIYKEGYLYQKITVLMLNLISEDIKQQTLFGSNIENPKGKKLMQTIDNLNKSLGKNTVYIASQGSSASWQPQRNKLSKQYTTNWDQLPIVK